MSKTDKIENGKETLEEAHRKLDLLLELGETLDLTTRECQNYLDIISSEIPSIDNEFFYELCDNDFNKFITTMEYIKKCVFKTKSANIRKIKQRFPDFKSGLQNSLIEN